MAEKDNSDDPGALLAGVRILDLSRVLAGPWCTQTLADLGADVLKIEKPSGGDETRAWTPPEMGGVSAYFACANRNKRSLAVDLTSPEGAALVRDLAQEADVLVENFRAGSLTRFGLDSESLMEVNPGLVYCSISGYGHTGSQARRPGYDFVIQAESGLMSITGTTDGPPVKVGVAISDLTASFYAGQAVLAALLARQQTGRGRFIDVALFDCQVAALANVTSNYLATETSPSRYGNAHANVVPYEVFEASDGPFVLAVGNDAQFRRLCRNILGEADLAESSEYATNSARVRNRDALGHHLAEVFAQKPRADWLEQLAQADIPAGAINSVAEAVEGRQSVDHQLIASPEQGGEAFRMARHPVAYDGVRPAPRTAPPHLGEGGDAALADWLSLADEEIAGLRRNKAIT